MVEFWMGAYDCCRASPTAVRSAEAAREISHRESEFRESCEQLHHTSQNRDMKFTDKEDSVWATLEDRWQVEKGFIGESGIGFSRVP
jgi:hypothetical protein